MNLISYESILQTAEQTLKEVKNRNTTDILRKERKWNHIICSVKTTKEKNSGRQRHYKKRILQTNITDEYRCKNPQQNTRDRKSVV